jgi:hypothetical protein
MRRATIVVTRRGKAFDATLPGFGTALYTPKIEGASSEAEAIGRLVLLLSHPLGIKIDREKVEG